MTTHLKPIKLSPIVLKEKIIVLWFVKLLKTNLNKKNLAFIRKFKLINIVTQFTIYYEQSHWECFY